MEGSDHRPIVTKCGTTYRRKKRLFRYDRNLKDNPEVIELLEKAWNEQRVWTVAQRIQNCSTALTKWHRKKNKNSLREIEENKARLDIALSSLNPDELLIQKLMKELNDKYREEESYWRQRSRITWLALGDRNSSYFHSITRGRRAQNRLTVLEDSSGEAVYEEHQITEVITSYYQDLFKSEAKNSLQTVNKAVSPKVTQEMNDKLILIPDATEIRKAVFSINSDKCPGPDGFSASFFHTNWTFIEKDVVAEIQLFFETGRLPKEINRTHIRLIPKTKSPKTIQEYRLIALCNVYYKIISKILTQRLQLILDLIISENQSAFIPGRAINDNVIITHEALHYLKLSQATKHCTMAIKTDMTKAYDRLEWDFIKAVLLRLGFHKRWTDWIMQCITTISYSFLINGTANGNVIPSRGIRQGDPLSPFIFIMCGEVLTGMCLQAQRSGQFNGIRLSKSGSKLNHILFADDTMFFSKTDPKSCENLARILQQYEEASGQKINKLKSTITFSGKTSIEIKERVKLSLGIEKEGGNGKYLGLPELFGRKKKDLFNAIVDRIKQKAASWSTQRLSNAGKLVMLKSVLSAIPSYTMSCFLLPMSLCKRIQSTLTRFWWDSNPEKKSLCWVAWNSLVNSKENGGLGIREIQSFNEALIAKLSWRILQKPKCLMARLLTEKYCRHNSFLTVKARANSSHGWRSILAGRDLICSHLGKVIGDGRDTNIWQVPWLNSVKPDIATGPAPKGTEDWTVQDLFKTNTMDWDIERVQNLFPEIWEDIVRLRPSRRGAKDQWIWLATRNGVYSAKTGYHRALQSKNRAANTGADQEEDEPEFKWNKDVWHKRNPPKLQLFLWKAARGALAVAQNLVQRRVITAEECIRCGEPETIQHVLFQCQYAQQVWKQTPFREALRLETIQNFKTSLVRAKLLTNLPPIGLPSCDLFSWVCWGLWQARNVKVFENRSTPENDLVTKILSEAREWQDIQDAILKKNFDKREAQKLLPPIPPSQSDPEIICCNTDAAWRESDKRAGLGWIFSDSINRETERGSTVKTFVKSPLVAEAEAIYEAIGIAKERGWRKIRIASDSTMAINAIKAREPPQDLYGIIHDILGMLDFFTLIEFRFVPRKENSSADSIAKDALRASSPDLLTTL